MRDSEGRRYLALAGPGIVLAATGVGAGDLIAAAVSGSKFGFAVIWAAVVGAVLKWVMSEGLARWQLATGTTLLQGWASHLGRWVQYVFLVYLVVWSFVVGGALVSACGLAGHALFPAVSVKIWGALHSVVAAAVVLLGGYARFEGVMKTFIAVMFAALIGCALFVASPVDSMMQSIGSAAIPAGGARLILGVIGGVGGSVTLLSYGYWIREKGWDGPRWLRTVRVDLTLAYVLTGAFGVAVMVLAARVLHVRQIPVEGGAGVVRMAEMLVPVLGDAGRRVFLVGFWAAVATSMLGVWQGVPYIFCDFVGFMWRMTPERHRLMTQGRSIPYRGFLAWLALPSMSLLFINRPVAVIMAYSVLGALFMPFLAGTLLYLNSRSRWVGKDMTNGPLIRILLLLSLVLFGYLAYVSLRAL